MTEHPAPQPAAPPVAALDSGLPALLQVLLPVWRRLTGLTEQQLKDSATEMVDTLTLIIALQQRLVGHVAGHVPDDPVLRALAEQLDHHCDRALHAMQFVDRLEQSLRVLQDDQQRLITALPELPPMDRIGIELWMDALSCRYTSEEQRRAHRGEASGTPEGEVQFF